MAKETIVLDNKDACRRLHVLLAGSPEKFLGAVVFLRVNGSRYAPKGAPVSTVVSVERKGAPINPQPRENDFDPAPEPEGWESVLVTPAGKGFIPGGDGHKENFSDFFVEKIILEVP